MTDHRLGRLAAISAALVSATALTAPAVAQTKPLKAQEGTVLASRGFIRAHLGEMSPFYGESPAFWGATDPLAEDLKPFWGTLVPYRGFIRAHEGDVVDMRGFIRAHLGEISATRGFIRAHWDTLDSFEASPEGYQQLADYLKGFVQESEDFWGAAVEAGTGSSFSTGFADPLLAKYGIDLSDPSSLAGLDPNRREMFFLEWHDNLMQFSGADQVDHWMKPVNWTPKLTQNQGSGSRAVIGLIDFFVANDPDIKNKVIYSGGYTDFTSHGAGVASLILASHDGKGIMGIAPNARVAAYNPFDETHSASWADVTTGIAKVTAAGASVVNLSLGVPGWTLHPEWRNVMKASSNKKDQTIYVIAAGNSGTTQTTNVDWKDAWDNTVLVVGSVDPSLNISSFSNSPGWVCLLDGDQCKDRQRAGVGSTGDRFIKGDYLKESGLLMNRFLVAPGEMILVADGKGGVTRMSGTSFAAPLVSGAIALIHDRWPWLKKYPRDVANILLKSAQDLGEKGADPIYGRGLLDIEAAQNVLDFDNLKYELWNGTKKNEVKVETLRSQGFQSIWATNDMYFTAFEKLDSAERDFLIPLSSRLFGTMKNGQYFQEFVYNHFVNWLANPSSSGLTGARTYGFSDVRQTPLLSLSGGWTMNMSGRMVSEQYSGGGQGTPRLRSTFTLASPEQRLAFSFGSGDGALNLGGLGGLQTTADLDPFSGGVNPLLGFASGGAHLSSTVRLAPGLAISAGSTTQRRSLEQDREELALADYGVLERLDRYAATAHNVRVDYSPARWLDLSASWTRLNEDKALFGVRSLSEDDFGQGAKTDGLTLGADVGFGHGIALFGSATASRTADFGGDGALEIGEKGVVGTAYQIGVAKQGLLGSQDRLRLTLSQPLTVEQGTVEFESVQVIDRETGEKGLVTQTFDIGAPGQRRYVAEFLYGTPMLDGQAGLSLFGRGELRNVDDGRPRLIVGAKASLDF